MAILSNINGKFAVEDNGAIKFNNLTGTNNQVLIANTNSSPTWVDVSTIIGGPYLPLTGGTLAGAGNLVVGGTLTVNGVSTFNAALSGTSATFSGAVEINGIGTWNTPSGGVAFNVDAFTDGYGVIRFRTNDNTSKWDVGINNSNHFYIGNNGVNTAIEIEEVSSNATFAGYIKLDGGNQIYFVPQTGESNTEAMRIVRSSDTMFFTYGVNANEEAFSYDSSGNTTFAGSITATSASIPTMASNTNFTGDIYQYGSIFRNASFIDVVGNRNSKIELETAYFTNTVSNLAVNIQFPNVAMQGYYKITLSGSYSHQDISGKLTKVIPFGYNPNGSIWRTGNNQSEITIATGGVSTNFTIGNLAWDSTNSKFIVPVYKLTSSGNSVRILIEYFGAVADNLKDVNLSSNYTLTAPSPFNVRQYQNIRDKLGIGTTTPGTYKLNVAGTGLFTGGLEMAGGGAVYQGQKFWLDGGGDTFLESPSSNIMTFTTGGTERMRIKSNGQIDFASPGTPNQSGISMFGGTSGGIMYMYRPVGQNGDIIRFQTAISSTASTRVGYINTTSSATTYNSASDYRLKENVTKITNALDRVSKLKPSRFNFIIEPKNTVDGFIAHEVQKIVPEAVTGVKDDIDENGNNHYQGMDNARLVPLLTAAIQELEVRVKELENK